MSGSRERTCYVAMPFGMKPDGRGGVLDFNYIYEHAIAPAILAAGLEPLRRDALPAGVSIVNAVIELIMSADVMIADLSSRDPNVMYELGIRHATRRSGTVLITGDLLGLPFDLAHLRVIPYQFDDRGRMAEDAARTLRGLLTKALAVAPGVDSPLYARFPELSVSLPGTLPSRSPADFLRQRLIEAQRMSDLDEIRSVEQEIVRVAGSDRALLTEVMLAYRDLSAWSDVVRVTRTFPEDLRADRVIVQQLALAMNRSGDGEGAERELLRLIERDEGDAETYGLLGRIFKDRWQVAGDREALDRAIEAYRDGFERDPTSYYVGINVATLLAVRSDAADNAELDVLLPDLRRLLNDSVDKGHADYWHLATSLELAVLDADMAAAAELLDEVLARAAWPWMTRSTARNLSLLAETPRIQAGPELATIIERLEAGRRVGGAA